MNEIPETENLSRRQTDPGSGKKALPLDPHFEYIVGALTTAEQGGSTGWRTLPFHLCYVTCGNPGKDTGKTLLEIAGSEPVKCGFKEVVFIPAGVAHRVKDISESPSYQSVWIHFRMRILGALDLISFYDVPPNIGKNDRIFQKMQDLVNLPKDLDFFDSARQQLLGFDLVSELLRFGTRNRLPASWRGDMERLMPVFQFLTTHSTEHIPLARLARKVNLSPSRFLALFHQFTGCSPGKFRENERFRQACVLLQKGELKFSEIAEILGYCDEFHFSRKFKQSSGINPKNYIAHFRSIHPDL